jgi:hypothetical protein
MINGTRWASSCLLPHMVLSTWLQTCSYSQYGGFAKVSDFLHRILAVLPSSLSRSLSLPDIFCKFATALSLSDSSRSFSSASFGHTVVSVAVHKLQCFISSGSTGSAPYVNQNSVKFVALHSVVLWLHTTVGMTCQKFSPICLSFHPRVFS